MMTRVILIWILLLINVTTSQIPNPNQYRFTLTTNSIVQERYAIDVTAGKMSRMWFSNDGDEQFGGNQDIYVRHDKRTYLFNFMAQPPQCIANKVGPPNEMFYWPNLVRSFGGEQKIYDDLIFDADCDGTCLTWKVEGNSTYEHKHYHYITRLYVKKAEQKPIKLVMKTFDLDTGKLISSTDTRFLNWTTGEVPDYEFDYPMDLNTCYQT
ncbi:unnamed protein product [Rotaria sp. Silwood2]|nr:unnamed protein product [Rotaria sp. Silwood2]CAF2686485.1 unnamed protein product [Rotaria sp. Silwood2]CAF2949979.1 unnamed protein product [Rotaria sp. Silwood2]CAF3152414.1 unnamed protein product [Rotaria sp. Silwood2]CAF4117103.1 unnamed protein product [Rotaria sp. Silwood2]